MARHNGERFGGRNSGPNRRSEGRVSQLGAELASKYQAQYGFRPQPPEIGTTQPSTIMSQTL